MKTKLLFSLFMFIVFLNFCSTNHDENKEVIPYRIVYKQALFIDNDTFFRAIVVFQKEFFESKIKFLSIDKSAIQIAKENDLIYSEYYFPYIKDKFVLDTTTILNSKINNHIGWYLGKIDLLKYKENWKKKIDNKDFVIGSNNTKRLVRIGRQKQ